LNSSLVYFSSVTVAGHLSKQSLLWSLGPIGHYTFNYKQLRECLTWGANKNTATVNYNPYLSCYNSSYRLINRSSLF